MIKIKDNEELLDTLKNSGWTQWQKKTYNAKYGYGTPELWKHPTRELFFRVRDRTFGTKLAYDKLFTKTLCKVPTFSNYKILFDVTNGLIIVEDFMALKVT